MREIKFRGKDIHGVWRYGYLFQGKTKNNEKYSVILKQSRYNSDDRLYEDLPFAFYKDEVYVINPDTIGQFTGLHDKNGKEIYEGDILLRKCFNPNSQTLEKVEYKSEVYFSTTTNPSGWRIKNSTKTGGWSAPLSQVKIYNNEAVFIGNIHDNPELLKQL